jgi:hypothetical protein
VAGINALSSLDLTIIWNTGFEKTDLTEIDHGATARRAVS